MEIVVVSEHGTRYKEAAEILRSDEAGDRILRVGTVQEAFAVMRRTGASYMLADAESLHLDKGSVPDSAAGQRGTAETDLEPVTAYIETHFAEKLTIPDLSSILHISPNYLCALFRKKLHTTAGRYIENVRMQKAAYMLLTTDLPVAVIARRTGYRHASYFSRCFARMFGRTPAAYRKTNRTTTKGGDQE